MRKIYLLLLFISLCPAIFAQSDSVPNPGFENWGPNPLYDEAQGWNTLNPLAQIIGGPLAYKTTDIAEVGSGNHSMKLVTTDLTIGATPSIATNGVVNPITQNVESGTPFDVRPAGMHFLYRCDPVGSDSALASVTLTRWNSSSNMREMVGFGEVILGSTSTSWETGEVEISYSSNENPDTVRVLFGSGDDVNPEIGTTLMVDDVEFVNSLLSIDDESNPTFSIYPNPVDNVLNYSSGSVNSQALVNVYSYDGKLMISDSSNNGSVNVESLSQGFYILEFVTSNDETVRKRFVKR